MAVWTYEVATEFNFPNITIYKRLRDGIQTGWRANANEGYVFYDPNEINLELDPETGEDIQVTYYFRVSYLPLNHNFANFRYVAVPESEVPADKILGGSNNNHEIA